MLRDKFTDELIQRIDDKRERKKGEASKELERPARNRERNTVPRG